MNVQQVPSAQVRPAMLKSQSRLLQLQRLRTYSRGKAGVERVADLQSTVKQPRGYSRHDHFRTEWVQRLSFGLFAIVHTRTRAPNVQQAVSAGENEQTAGYPIGTHHRRFRLFPSRSSSYKFNCRFATAYVPKHSARLPPRIPTSECGGY